MYLKRQYKKYLGKSRFEREILAIEWKEEVRNTLGEDGGHSPALIVKTDQEIRAIKSSRSEIRKDRCVCMCVCVCVCVCRVCISVYQLWLTGFAEVRCAVGGVGKDIDLLVCCRRAGHGWPRPLFHPGHTSPAHLSFPFSVLGPIKGNSVTPRSSGVALAVISSASGSTNGIFLCVLFLVF